METVKEIEKKANDYFSEYLGVVWANYSDVVKSKIIFGYVQGYVAKEIEVIKERIKNA